MRLYLLRHGEADWPGWKEADDERPLTKAGRKEMHQVGEFLAALRVRPDVILTSPLPRAAQTADIAAEHLKVRASEEKLLAPGFRAEELTCLRRKYPQQVLMLVGHEPDFTSVISALTGADLKLSKGGVALLEISGTKGKLLWLFPPKVAKI
ncbi:MAG: phosphohistidine phosphatase SixA [Verrucomicrobiota bacterium]|nr:phosphohistidine phosphatase SixA [Chthoniobacterales bacterium]MDQ3414342.1 phosphohistidine phosphatase SixA [Verrucomicrobiota bacterium]